MKHDKLALACGVLMLAVATGGCSRLKARDQLNKGVASFRSAQFQAAIMHFKESVRLDPTLLNAKLYLATAYAQLYIPGGESEDNVKLAKQAIAGFDDVLTMDPQNTTAIASAAQIYYQMKDFDKAKEYQRRRLDLEPNNPEPYYWIGVINWALCYPRQAQLRKDLKLNIPADINNPDTLPPLPEKARAQLQKDNGPLVEEGLKALQKAVELKPNYSDAMVYLSLTYRQRADLDGDKNVHEADVQQANEWVQKALDIRKGGGEQAAPATSAGKPS
jgi:tetratricopeptide (TPR) repeat protein